MRTLRPASERGHADHGWLDTRHTFSFAGYHDPLQMGFRALRVINEDRVQPSAGFGEHGHRDMEIVSYVVDGALEHRDSLGNGSVLRAGDVQRMTAGTGVRHSEWNPSGDTPAHFLQIWIVPRRSSLTPSWEERHFSRDDKRGGWRRVVSPDGRDGSLRIHQDVELFAAVLEPGETREHAGATGRHAWLQMVSGRASLGPLEIGPGDGVAFSDEPRVALTAHETTEVLLFDLP